MRPVFGTLRFLGYRARQILITRGLRCELLCACGSGDSLCLKKDVMGLYGLAWCVILIPLSAAAAQIVPATPPTEATVNPKPIENEKASFQWSKALRQSG